MAGARANRRLQDAYLPPLHPKLGGFNHLSVCGPLIRHSSYDSTHLGVLGPLIWLPGSATPIARTRRLQKLHDREGERAGDPGGWVNKRL